MKTKKAFDATEEPPEQGVDTLDESLLPPQLQQGQERFDATTEKAPEKVEAVAKVQTAETYGYVEWSPGKDQIVKLESSDDPRWRKVYFDNVKVCFVLMSKTKGMMACVQTPSQKAHAYLTALEAGKVPKV